MHVFQTHFSALSFLYTTLLSGGSTTPFNMFFKTQSHCTLLCAAARSIPPAGCPAEGAPRLASSRGGGWSFEHCASVITFCPIPEDQPGRDAVRKAGWGTLPTWWPARRKRQGEPLTEYHYLASSGGRRKTSSCQRRNKAAVACSFFKNYFNSLGHYITWSAIGSKDVWKFSLVVIFHTAFF